MVEFVTIHQTWKFWKQMENLNRSLESLFLKSLLYWGEELKYIQQSHNVLKTKHQAELKTKYIMYIQFLKSIHLNILRGWYIKCLVSVLNSMINCISPVLILHLPVVLLNSLIWYTIPKFRLLMKVNEGF